MANVNNNTASNVVAFPEVKSWSGREVVPNLKKRVENEFIEVEELRQKTYKSPQWLGNLLFFVTFFQFITSVVKNAFSGYMTGAQIEVSKAALINPFAVAESANFIIFQFSMLAVSTVLSQFAYKYVSKSIMKWPILIVGVPALFVSLFANLAWMFGVQNGTDTSPVLELFKAVGGRNYETVQWTVNIFISFATEFSLFFIPLMMVYLNTPKRERRMVKRLAKELRMSEESKKDMGAALADRDETENEIHANAFTQKQSRTRKVNRANAKDTLINERKIIVDYLRHNARAGVVRALWHRFRYWLTGHHNVPAGYIKQILGSGEKKEATPL